MPEPEVKPEPAVFDPKAVETMIQGAVKTSLESLIKEGAARQQQKADDDAAAEAQKTQAANPFQSMVEPAIAPALKAAKDAETRANMAADAVAFYTDSSNAEASKYRDKIEQVVQAQLKQGIMTSRADAWRWLRGGELYAEVTKGVVDAHTKQIEDARLASAAGPGTTVPVFKKPMEEHSTEELGTALKGLVF